MDGDEEEPRAGRSSLPESSKNLHRAAAMVEKGSIAQEEEEEEVDVDDVDVEEEEEEEEEDRSLRSFVH